MSEFKLLIDGDLVEGADRLAVINPANESIVAYAPRSSKAQLEAAVHAAKRAQPGWAKMAWSERQTALHGLANEVDAAADELARLLTAEQGKPLPEAQGEISLVSQFIRYFADSRIEPEKIDRGPTRDVEQFRTPLGVVAAIIPWNFPLLIVAFKLPPALVAGNTIVIKPAPTTPLTTLRFGELCQRCLPPGVVNIVVDNNDLGEALTTHPDVAKVSFTGSTATGKKVMAAAAGGIKRLTLELGGNDPAIVLDDVDPEGIAPGLFASAFLNAGQVCIAIKRLYVHDSVYDRVCAALAKLADLAIVDDGAKQGAQIGPLQNRQQFEKIKTLLNEARKTGRVVAGGDIPDRMGYFVRPTIVADIKDGTQLVDEEQFGPILPVIRYTDLDDVIDRANASDYGLGASVWGTDMDRARAVAARIDAGTVWINKHIDLDPGVPFAGGRQSGLGVEFAAEGLKEFTQLKIINAAV